MDKKINIVIMAGGTGTRFWPYSRNKNPKQFLDVLNTGKSLLQMTYDRFIEHVPKDQIWIVSNVMYRELISVQIPDLPQIKYYWNPASEILLLVSLMRLIKFEKKIPTLF